MTWAGQTNRDEKPLSLRLINSAVLLLKYVIRGHELPRDEVQKLRDQTRLEDEGSSKQLQADLRQIIADMTLDPKSIFKLAGRNMGPTVMWILCYPYDKNRRVLEIVMELPALIGFTLSGYNLKEITELTLRADRWLDEMAGHNDPEDIRKRRWVENSLPDLLEFLYSTYRDNYTRVETARKERLEQAMVESMTKVGAELCRRRSPEELLSEIAEFDTRIAEAWNFLRKISHLDSPEAKELKRRIVLHEKPLQTLNQRINARKRRGTSYLITPEEEAWQGDTEKELTDLRSRLYRHLHGNLLRQVMPEINLILSATSGRDSLQAEMEA